MRVAFALGGTDAGRSGIGIYVREIVPRLREQLVARGDELVAFGSGADVDAYAQVLKGTTAHRLPIPNGAGPNAALHLVGGGVLPKFLGADVLLLPAANRRLTGFSMVPTVAVVHDLAQLKVDQKYDPLRMFYLRYAVVGALRSATELVTVSAATRVDLAKVLARDPSTISVVLNGVDADRFHPATEGDPRVSAARGKHQLSKPYVLYLSRLEHPGKNHVRLVEAFARSGLAETHELVLAGGDWGAQELIEARVRELEIAPSVRLLGYVDDESVPGLMAGAEAVAMVGLHEGFGLPALEALAAGRPVCVSNTGALPEVVGDLGSLCDPLDVEAMTKALRVAVTDADYRARVGREGPGYARERGWDATARGLIDACDRALGRSAR